jgi:large repetitive protein
MSGRTATILGGGLGVFMAVLAVALILFARCAPTPTRPTAHTTPAATPSPVERPSPSPSPSPEPSLSPSPTPTPPPPPLAFGDLTLHPGDQGVAYVPKQFTAAGGTPPYAWALTSGTLPPGLALSSDGVLSGTPTALGNFVFSVGVSDSGGAGSAAGLALNIAPPPSIAPACAQPCSVEAGCKDVCGGFGTLSGGSAPFSYLPDGQTPAGTLVDGLALEGTFAEPAGGKPQAYAFTVQLTDAAGATAKVTANFLVNPHISLDSPTLPDATAGNPYDVSIPFHNAWGVPSFTVTGSLAPGLGVSLAGSNVRISGTPTGGAATYNFKITLTDQAICGAGPTNCAAGHDYTIKVS